ncbi:LacI family DNA-binding transcriptional regulator [Roseateles violae]|uniref:LacI family DNA-binding transcriptional regulator n=1 Tax=Roseateles violae TaxID=3058042 RepID=A0ABT8DZZ2_9BURK|nr:LacI family DNA-binding transcriptional regulator [Pelomonas sp. PFR6]MDN3923160.1 LacI family DNA-binding transcriptional regulator [Pelomonas sp. PFR6]
MASRAAGSSAPTIVDVAAQAGVSIKTVSRVLNQEPGVQEKTREQVLKVVAELKYRPKLSARSLAGARSFLIGLLYYDPSAAFVAGVQQGATLRCREAGYHLVVESLHNDAPDIDSQVERVVSALRPDGMVLTPPLCDNPKVLKALRESGTPCVLMSPGRQAKGQASVRMDDVHAAEEVTNLLISLGHERIGFIRGASDQAASGLRYQGFANAMKAHGLGLDPELIQQGDFTFQSGVDGAHQLLSRRVRPTAVFASNDDMALGVLAAAQRLGLAVPSDLSIAGFDDSPAASLVWPPLTTVRQPVDQMARMAVEMLIAANRSDAQPLAESDLHRVLPYELLVRNSTCAPAAKPVTKRK